MAGTVSVTFHVSGITEVQARALRMAIPPQIGGLMLVIDQVSYVSDAA